MIQFIFLGSGSAYTVGDDNFQSNILVISEQGKKLLIDCGSDIRWSLHQAGFSYTDITDVYISHLHSDHVGGLDYIGFNRKFHPQCPKPNLYLSQDLVADLWQRTLAGGMESIEGELASLETYFTVQAIDRQGCFVWEGQEFTLVKMTHVHNGFFPIPAYGLFCSLPGQRVFLTTDTQFCLPAYQTYYEQADLIFHDCETSQHPTPVHAHYTQLLTLPEAIRQKMWLYGYQPGPRPDACRDGFRGFVRRGQVFEFTQAGMTEIAQELAV